MQKAQAIVFPDKQEVELREIELPDLKPDEVLVENDLSLMSTGTENIIFNRDFEPDSGWDFYNKYPVLPGYASVGRVIATGQSVHSLSLGDQVAIRTPHSSHAVVKESGCSKIPAGLENEEAVWFALAKISFLGVRAARLELGDQVMVLGAGPIGQMAIRWARVAGATSIAALDLAPARKAAAVDGGANRFHIGTADDIRDEYLKHQHGPLPKVVIDTTGNHRVFAPALGLAAKYGRVVLLGVSGQPGLQTLTKDVIRKGLTIIGVHDSQNPPEWPQEAIIDLFFTLAVSGCFPLEHLITHRFAPSDCQSAYHLANTDRANTMGIVFVWKPKR